MDENAEKRILEFFQTRLKANPNRPAICTIVESHLDKAL